MPSNDYKFRVKFDKADHNIDTETYVKALSSLTAIMKEANYQTGSNGKISINVEAQDTGSFDVELVLKTVQDLFGNDSVQYLAALVTVTGGLVSLRKVWSKADDSKTEINGDDVTIKDIGGNVIYQTTKNTYNIFTTNQVVQDALANNFKGLADDETVTGFELNYDDETVRVERDDFAELSKRVEVQLPDQDISEVSTNLIIVKLVFEGADRKWDFLYNGSKIAAAVQDKNFWNEIDNGRSFSKGDELVATLRIIREYDPTVAAYINKDYQVIDVREHHPRAIRQQMKLEDINDQESI